MDFDDSPEEAAHRAEVRTWLRGAAGDPPVGDTYAGRLGPEEVRSLRNWSRRLYEAGYAAVTWPAVYGGRDLPPGHQAIVLEELERAGLPGHVNVIGIGMAGPTILAHGSAAQRERFLRPILSAEEIWCQGFSEPGAGSDLAALRTRAVPDRDGFVVTGQKVWSSFAHAADRCLLLCRTSDEPDRHDGLTYLILDMRAPGVEVRPIRQITGESEFNELFLDGVRVPADAVLGRVGEGWRVAITTLMNERAFVGLILASRLLGDWRALADLAAASAGPAGGSTAAAEPEIRRRLAELWADTVALRVTTLRALSALQATGRPGPEGSVAKLFWSRTNQRLMRTAFDVQGSLGGLVAGSDLVPEDGRWQRFLLRSRGSSIEAGTSEVLRGIVAERVLGLPRSR